MRIRSATRAALAVALLLACSPLDFLARSATPTGPAVPSGSTGGSTPVALETAIEAWVELDPPPPAGILDALQAGVDEGATTYAEGLIAALQLFTGERRTQEIFADVPSDLEGFGVVLEAQRYVREGDDPVARAEIERLLGILGPTSDRLLDHALPAPAANSGSPGLASRGALADECVDLFPQYAAQGFPPGSAIKCLLYKEGGIAGQTLRVYWPIAYFTQPEYADQAYAGMVKAFQTFAQLKPNGGAAQMRGVDLLFVILPSVEEPTTLAMVPSAVTDDRCLIMVYLGAIQQNEILQTGDQDYGVFLQTIAHEMFHCFQVWNFPNQADGDWKIQDWWGEGTAEYFSNVVYPSVNFEHRWINDMAFRSANTSVVDMSYGNFAFFQQLGNTGNSVVLDLISKMPGTGGASEQAAALSGFGDMQNFFHTFGRAYMDGKILDTTGAPIPTIPPHISSAHRFEIKDNQVWSLEAPPFVIDRYAVTFPQGNRYTIAEEVKGDVDGRHAARIDTIQGWSTIPEEVATACGPVTYFLLLTTSQTDGGKYTVQLDFQKKEDVACDECLIGVWDLNEPSFQAYSEAPFAEIPGFYHYGGAGGLFRYTFRADGTLRGEFNFTYLYALTQDNSPYGEDVRIDGAIGLNGDGEGFYTTSGVGHLTMTLADDSVSMANTMFINGEEVGESSFGASLPNKPYGYNYGSGVMSPQYSCDEDAGKLYLNFLPESNTLPPLQFDLDQ